MKQQWRFVCEALVHISSLRLFVSKASGLQCCGEIRNLSARISFSASGLVLVCEWDESEEKRASVHVPLPLCALDHSAPVELLAREDHIEVKLKLLDAGICLLKNRATEERGLGFKALLSADGKEELLKSLHCRACNAKLTRGDFKSIVELPSVDWRDIADHWFGICCCGSSIKTETMVARFEQNVAPARGKLLVSSTSCIIHLQDFCEGAVTVAEGTCSSVEEQNNGEDCNGADDQQGLDIENGTCSPHQCGDHTVQRTRKSLPTSFYDFLRGPVQPLSTGTWQPLHCCQCGSLLGTYETELMHAVHLFKRSIVASKPSTFRYHTLQKDFLDDLVSQSEHNSSYRFVVRDLVQRTPLVQLVLLNQDALISFGTLESTSEDRLRPAVSLMFADCRDYASDQLRHVEQWSTEQKADDIFMLEEEVHLLLDELQANHSFFPESYSVAKGLKMSFLQTL